MYGITQGSFLGTHLFSIYIITIAYMLYNHITCSSTYLC